MSTATPPSPAGEVAAPAGMVLVPGGPFKLGQKGEESTLPDFWIDLTPVTNKQYSEFVAATGRRSPNHWGPDGYDEKEADCPVVFVTFADAEAYAKWAGKALPTPAQFEKAARGPDGRKFPWGDTVGLRTANTKESGIGKPTSVQAYPRGKSPYGCVDMNGNVLQWTRGKTAKDKGEMVVKGCSFRHYLGPVSWVYEEPADKRQDCIGFRCVWTKSP
jgi:formylglycine-generating enzyme required for sulfatase activity